MGGQTLCDKISLTIILFERIFRKTSRSFLDFHHTFTVILPSVTRDLDNSNSH